MTSKEYHAEWRKKNIESARASARAWAARNKEKVAKTYKEWAAKNPDKARAKTASWKKRNRASCTALENKRRAGKLGATPKWVDLEVIKNIYLNCPKGYHVDHIIPLNHPDVCGLHVPWNLQYLPASENMKKYNKLPQKQQTNPSQNSNL